MVVGVDQPGQHHVLTGIEDRYVRRGGIGTNRHEFDNTAILHDNAALGAFLQDSEWIFDPKCR
jgi:hypothetical protein